MEKAPRLSLDVASDTYTVGDVRHAYSRKCAHCTYIYTGNRVVLVGGKKDTLVRKDAYYVDVMKDGEGVCGLCASNEQKEI